MYAIYGIPISRLRILLKRTVRERARWDSNPRPAVLNTIIKSPYYIDEAEVPRNGITVSESCQRTVWHTGDIFLWIGRKKLYGTCEGSS
jgi:hypothetical protein